MSAEVARWEQPTLPAGSRDVVDGWAHQVGAVAKLATYIAATDFVPKAYRGQDAAVAAAILAGREMGIGPMTALQHLYVVDGRPAMSAQLMRALVFAHGHTIRVAEANSERCTLIGRRAGEAGDGAHVTWTMEDARRAQVAGKQNWARYPRQMLMARATGELCRAIFPDVIGGMAYTVEEADDIPAAENGTAPPTRTVRRARAPKAAPPPAAPSEAAAPPEPPRPAINPGGPGGEPPPLPDAPRSPGNAPLPPEQGQEAPEHPEPDSAAHKPATDSQRGELWRLLGQLDRTTPRAERLRTISALIGRRIESTHDLRRGETTALIDVLIRCTEAPDILDPLVDEGWAKLNPPLPPWQEPPDDTDRD